jgi:hypothetical protein
MDLQADTNSLEEYTAAIFRVANIWQILSCLYLLNGQYDNVYNP